nr:intraflagellar transport protein 22 homolog isoform X3 [Procambarus clarkii]
MTNKVKLLMVGPTECGKTTLTNFLSEAGEVGGGEYRPTKASRIVEFEIPNLTVNSMTTKAEVELWDVSGDRSPGREDHARTLDTLYTHFVEQQGLRETQCVVFCHYKPGFQGKGAKLSNSFNQIPKMDTQLDEESGSVRRDFNHFVASVLGHMSAVAEMQENSILS